MCAAPWILEDLAPSALATAVEENLGAWVRLKGRLPDVELYDAPDLVWIFSTTPGRGGAVVLPRLAPATADARIEEVLARHRRHGVETTWWVGPGAAPDDLGRRLRAHGVYCQRHMPGMACDLAAARTGFRRPEGLEIRAVDDFSVFDRHQHPFFGPMTTARRRTQLDGVAQLVRAEPERVRHLVASVAGVPLGCATAFLAAGVAGLYHVGTVERARGRGIGKAVTLAAMAAARERGYRAAILHASADGEPIYRQIGFAEVCTMSHWYYSKARQVREAMAARQAAHTGRRHT